MQRWKRTFGIILLLVLGFLGGLTAATWWYRSEPAPRRSDHMVNDWKGTLRSELNLNESQQQLLEQIGEETRQELRLLHHEYRPRLDEIFTGAHNKLIPSLTDAQRERLEQLIRERWSRKKDKNQSTDQQTQN